MGFFSNKKRKLDENQREIKFKVFGLVDRASENPDKALLGNIDQLSVYLQKNSDNKEVLMCLVDVIKEYIKSPDKDAKSKYYALQIFGFFMRKKNELLEIYFISKMMDRLYKIAKCKTSSKDSYPGENCLHQFDKNSHKKWSSSFYLLLLELWKNWGETYATDSRGNKESKIRKLYNSLVKSGVKFDHSNTHFRLIDDMRKAEADKQQQKEEPPVEEKKKFDSFSNKNENKRSEDPFQKEQHPQENKDFQFDNQFSTPTSIQVRTSNPPPLPNAPTPSTSSSIPIGKKRAHQIVLSFASSLSAVSSYILGSPSSSIPAPSPSSLSLTSLLPLIQSSIDQKQANSVLLSSSWHSQDAKYIKLNNLGQSLVLYLARVIKYTKEQFESDRVGFVERVRKAWAEVLVQGDGVSGWQPHSNKRKPHTMEMIEEEGEDADPPLGESAFEDREDEQSEEHKEESSSRNSEASPRSRRELHDYSSHHEFGKKLSHSDNSNVSGNQHREEAFEFSNSKKDKSLSQDIITHKKSKHIFKEDSLESVAEDTPQKSKNEEDVFGNFGTNKSLSQKGEAPHNIDEDVFGKFGNRSNEAKEEVSQKKDDDVFGNFGTNNKSISQAKDDDVFGNFGTNNSHSEGVFGSNKKNEDVFGNFGTNNSNSPQKEDQTSKDDPFNNFKQGSQAKKEASKHKLNPFVDDEEEVEEEYESVHGEIEESSDSEVDEDFATPNNFSKVSKTNIHSRVHETSKHIEAPLSSDSKDNHNEDDDDDDDFETDRELIREIDETEKRSKQSSQRIEEINSQSNKFDRSQQDSPVRISIPEVKDFARKEENGVFRSDLGAFERVNNSVDFTSRSNKKIEEKHKIEEDKLEQERVRHEQITREMTRLEAQRNHELEVEKQRLRQEKIDLENKYKLMELERRKQQQKEQAMLDEERRLKMMEFEQQKQEIELQKLRLEAESQNRQKSEENKRLEEIERLKKKELLLSQQLEDKELAIRREEEKKRMEELNKLQSLLHSKESDMREVYNSNIEIFRNSITSLKKELISKTEKEKRLEEENITIKEKNEKLNEALQKLSSTVKILENDNATLVMAKTDFEAENQMLEEQLNELKSKDIDDKLVSQVFQMAPQIGEVQNLLSNKEKELADIVKELHVQKKKSDALEHRNKRLEELTLSYEERVESIKLKHKEELVQKGREYEQEIENVIVSMRKEIEDLETRISLADEDNLVLRSKLLKASTHNEPIHIQSKNITFTSTIDSSMLQSKIEDLSAANIELRDKLVKLRIDKERAESSLEQSHKINKNLEHNLETVKSKSRSLEESLHLSRQEMYKNEAEMERLSSLLNIEISQSQQLKKELDESAQREKDFAEQIEQYHSRVLELSERSRKQLSEVTPLEESELSILRIQNETLNSKLDELLDENLDLKQRVSELEIEGSLVDTDASMHIQAYETLSHTNHKITNELFEAQKRVAELEESELVQIDYKSRFDAVETELKVLLQLVANDEVMGNPELRKTVVNTIGSTDEKDILILKKNVDKLFDSMIDHEDIQREATPIKLQPKMIEREENIIPKKNIVIDQESKMESILQIEPEHQIDVMRRASPPKLIAKQEPLQRISSDNYFVQTESMSDEEYLKSLRATPWFSDNWRMANLSFETSKFYTDRELDLYYFCPNNISSNKQEVLIMLSVYAKSDICINDINLTGSNITYMSPQITGKTINKGDTIEMRLRITVNSLTCPLPPLLNFKYTCGSTIHPIRCHIPFTMFNLLQRIKSSASTCSTIFKNFTKELSTTFKLSSSSFKQPLNISELIKEAVPGIPATHYWLLCSSNSGRNFVIKISQNRDDPSILELVLKCTRVDEISRNYLKSIEAIFGNN